MSSSYSSVSWLSLFDILVKHHRYIWQLILEPETHIIEKKNIKCTLFLTVYTAEWNNRLHHSLINHIFKKTSVVKGTVSGNACDPPLKDDKAWFATVSLQRYVTWNYAYNTFNLPSQFNKLPWVGLFLGFLNNFISWKILI